MSPLWAAACLNEIMWWCLWYAGNPQTSSVEADLVKRLMWDERLHHSSTTVTLPSPAQLWLINNDVGSHGQNTQGRYEGEGGEEKQTHPVQNHRGELPVCLDRVRDLIILYLIRDYFDLLIICHNITLCPSSQPYLENSTEFPGYGGYLLAGSGIVSTVITARVRQVTQAPRQLILIQRQYWDWHQQHLLDIDVTNIRPHHHKYKQQTPLLSLTWVFLDCFEMASHDLGGEFELLLLFSAGWIFGNHRPYQEHWRATTWRRFPWYQAPSSSWPSWWSSWWSSRLACPSWGARAATGGRQH